MLDMKMMGKGEKGFMCGNILLSRREAISMRPGGSG